MKKTRKESPAGNKKRPLTAVEKNNDEDEDLPGYPHYPAGEDIMNHPKDIEKIDIDNIDELRTTGSQNKMNKSTENDTPSATDETIRIVPGTEADVTQEDLQMLGDISLNNDMGDDDLLKKRSQPVDMSGDDLDIPGAELDDAEESIGEEDEENNSYSLGGDRHENLEENSSFNEE